MVKHIEGKKNIADFLSRHMPIRPDAHYNKIELNFHINYIEVDSEIETIRSLVLVEEQLFDNMSMDKIVTETKSDLELAKLKLNA